MNFIISQELAQAILNHLTATPHIYAEIYPLVIGIQNLTKLEQPIKDTDKGRVTAKGSED